MKLEVLLSCINLEKSKLDRMNISSSCLVINQCERNFYSKYKHFKIYSYDEIGLSISRNRALDLATGDILLLCDDDVIYNDEYEKIILTEFNNNPQADVIVFNLESPNRLQSVDKKSKRLRIYNSLRYSSPRIAFRRSSIEKKNIRFNLLFGANAKYACGEDSLFLVDCLKNGLKIYACNKNIGTVYHKKSTWFKGYNDKFFFDKGAVFCAINTKLCYPLYIQYLLRHSEVLEKMSFYSALKLMIYGGKCYKNDIIKSRGFNNK